MFTKTAKKFWVFISSAVASVCLAVGAIAMPSANVAQAAIDGSLSEEVTLNKVVADADGKTAEGFVVQYKEFEMGESGNTWFMTEFTGKNAPNYAVRAAKGYSSWDGAYVEWVSAPVIPVGASVTKQGIMITNSNMFSQIGVCAFRGTSTMDTSYERGQILAPNDKGTTTLGMRYYNANTRYIQIVGYEHTTGNSAKYTVYLFKVVDDGIEVVANASVEDGSSWNALGGTKAVIYGNVQALAHAGADETTLSEANNPDSVTFQYATPANSLVNLLKGVTDHYEYKDDIVTALEITEDVSQKVEITKTETTVLSTSVNWNRVEAVKGIASNVQYAEFDGFNDDVWFITQFKGKNAPSYAVHADQGFATWDEKTATAPGAANWNDYKYFPMGTLITNSSEKSWTFLNVFRGSNTDTTAGADKRGSFGNDTVSGTYRYNDNTEYIQIIGYDHGASAFSLYLYKVESGALVEVDKVEAKVISAANGAIKGSKAVIYPNIGVTPSVTNGVYSAQGPASISFSYQAPQATLEGLVKSLSSTYVYKDDIAAALSIDIGAVQKETYTATYEDMAGNTLKTLTEVEAVKLPGSTLADFAGWYNKADGKLYKAGETIALTANTTFVEVATGVDLADGAAVRLVKDAAGVGGLRFEASFSKAAYDLLGANMKVEGGVIPTDLLNGEFALNNADARYVELTKTVLKGGEYHAYITLMNIKLENFQRAFSARVFVTVTYADGTKATIASEYNAEYHSRSIYQVAVKAYNSGNYGENEVLKYYIDNSASVALTVSEGNVGVTATHTYDGLAANYTRGYTVSGVSYAEGTVSFTVTLKDTTVNGDGVVTMWTAEKVSQEVVVTFVNGVASVNFPVAL